ncbi:MAG: M24 family metallopeptidase [Candidatus Aminicenantes bacterium]|nr:M24 family metallopeptidase [Candidatus Aminicenantes bacterium]
MNRFLSCLLILALMGFTAAASDDIGVSGVDDITKILPLRERADVKNGWLKWRLENIIPDLMHREGIDMWLVINREYNEDPVYMSLVPEPVMNARRTSILMFYDHGPEKGVERLSGSYYGMGEWYKTTWMDKSKKQFESLAEVIRKLDPKKIGINVSPVWRFGDGLTASLKDKLEKALGTELSSRFVSADKLCLGWLETRSPQELSLYRHICGIAHDLIKEFFSNEVITPDVTTTDDVVWWIRQRINDLGLTTWFQPSISIQRHKKLDSLYKDNPQVIRRGDMLHCDVGIVYLGLCTDMQWQAYVCHIGEEDAPDGLKLALDRANGVADILMNEYEFGRTGKAIVTSAMQKAADAGLRPLIYSHPLGVHGHAAGCTMEARPPQSAPEGTEENMKYSLHYNTVYVVEFSSTTSVPEWDGQDVRIGFEEDVVYTKAGCHYVDGHQKKLLLIR